MKRIVMITPSDSNLTVPEEEFARGYWDTYDVDKREVLDMEELPSLLRCMGIYMEKQRLERYYRLFFGQTLDTWEQEIPLDRFLILLSMILRNQLPIYRFRLLNQEQDPDYIQFAYRGMEDARSLFIEFDRDESGWISKDELSFMFSCFGVLDQRFEDFDVFLTDQFQRIDRDKDGKIQFDEFVEFYNNLLDEIAYSVPRSRRTLHSPHALRLLGGVKVRFVVERLAQSLQRSEPDCRVPLKTRVKQLYEPWTSLHKVLESLGGWPLSDFVGVSLQYHFINGQKVVLAHR